MDRTALVALVSGIGVTVAMTFVPGLIPEQWQGVARIAGVLLGVALMGLAGWLHWLAGPPNLETMSRTALRDRARKVADEARALEARQQNRDKVALQFRTKYRAEMMALCREIRRRLEIPAPPPHEVPNALDMAMFAGVRPATEAADYLDSLAHRLV